MNRPKKRRDSKRRSSKRTARRLLRTAAFAGVRGLAGAGGPLVVVLVKWWVETH